MVPDIVFYVILGLSAASLAVLTLLLLGIRAFSRVFSNIPATIQHFIDGFLWEESTEEGEDGVKRVVRKPSKAFLAQIETIVPVVAPILMKQGVEWAKKNVKIGNMAPGGAPGAGLDLGSVVGGLAQGGLGKALGLKGTVGKLADTFGPALIQRFAGGFLGGGAGAKPAAQGGGALIKELPK